jgi:(p)ppGpp synthase/HD superfamily hydrolase
MRTVKEALHYAKMKHMGQWYGDLPYYAHIKDTVEIAQQLNLSEVIQTACALHDILEDTYLSYNDLSSYFGKLVADIVYDVTDELGKNRKERKAKTYPKIRGNTNAILVKLCDRVANVRHAMVYDSKMSKLYVKEHKEFLYEITFNVHITPDMQKAINLLNQYIES